MRLIDANAVIGNMMEMLKNGYEAEDMLSAVNETPTVDAVPLGPLCRWLACYVHPPLEAYQEFGEPYITSSEIRASIWENELRKRMEKGLFENRGRMES